MHFRYVQIVLIETKLVSSYYMAYTSPGIGYSRVSPCITWWHFELGNVKQFMSALLLVYFSNENPFHQARIPHSDRDMMSAYTQRYRTAHDAYMRTEIISCFSLNVFVWICDQNLYEARQDTVSVSVRSVDAVAPNISNEWKMNHDSVGMLFYWLIYVWL